MWNYKTPKLWLARIPEFWDRTIPTGYPKSSSKFSLSFENQDVRDAVLEMESNINTEASIVTQEMLPENCMVNNYAGTYEVSGEAGVETLLSPEKVDSNNVIAMHYMTTDGESGEWVQIENITVKDGYVWGTLENFSPIAIFTYIKVAHVEESIEGILNFEKYIVAEGNPIKVFYDENENKVFAESDGLKEEINSKTLIIGGTTDGRELDSTSVTVVGLIGTPAIKVISGSVYLGEGFTRVGTVNCTCANSKLGSITGSYGAVRTDKVVFDFKDSTLDFIGCGEGYKNIGTIHPTFASRCWAKEVNMKMINVVDQLTFIGQNCEYFYVHNTYAYIEGGHHDYLIMGGSNDGTNITRMDVKNANIGIFQTTNRGNVADARATFTGCVVENLFVGGDATDSTVTGTTGKIRYEINASEHDSYNIVNGTDAGNLLTALDVDRILDSIKVSRSANVTIAPEFLNILGAKYIVK